MNPVRRSKTMGNNIETIKMIIKFYNMIAGTSFKSSNEANQNAVELSLRHCNDDVAKLKDHIRGWVKEHQEEATTRDGFEECMWEFRKETPSTTENASSAPTENQVTNSLGILEQALVKVVAETSAEKIENEIMGQVKQTIQDFIKEEYGSIEKHITTVIDGKKADVKGIQHEKFDTVLKFVANDEPVFLTGPAGSGKNVLCKQIAEALGLDFYFTNAVTQEYKLTGFTDAMGNYQETQFYKAFTQGGLFMLDEMDASIPEVLVILNAAIANRYFDFPAPIGYVEAHPDFRVIAAGNTCGHGADFEYVGRNQLDGASLDRFAIVRIDYSVAIENSVAMDIELADFCRDFRKSAEEAGIQVIVSYRGIGRLAKMMQLLSIDEALETCLTKGIEKDDIHMIEQGIHKNSKYKEALRRLVA